MRHETKPTDVGMNRTGIASSPLDGKQTIGASEHAPVPPRRDGQALEAERLVYASDAGPVGTMPPLANLKGIVKAVGDLLTGKHASVFLDQLGERLAFERTGARLYEALMVKLAAADEHPRGPTRGDLERIYDDEQRHFVLLKQAIEELGGDPTVVTPCADVAGVAASGWVQVLTDPRTTLTEGLKTILQAELVDGESWLALADLAARLGHDEMAARFRGALLEEEDHLARVRSWVLADVEGQVGLEPQEGSMAGAPPPTAP